MPPFLDVLVLTARRDMATIDAFLGAHVDRQRSEDRGDEELMVVPLDGMAPSTLAEHEWYPAGTLSRVIAFGLSRPSRAFWIYVEPSDPTIAAATLGFTRDDKLVVGVSIDDPHEEPANEQRATALLAELMQAYDAIVGMVTVEAPVPLTEDEMRGRRGDLLTFAFVERDACR
jgi:hypothetical protein